MNVIKEIERINKKEYESGIYGGSEKGSWHDKYKNSAWVYIGGLSYELSEGDIICVMSQWGEIEDINLVREKGLNKSKGFAFVKYEDQRSTILAVDNFNGVQLLGRTLRVDHVDQYKLPKEIREREEERLEQDPDANVLIGPGHAYSSKDLENEYSINHGQDLWAPNNSSNIIVKSNENDSNDSDDNNNSDNSSHNHKKSEKKKKKKKHHSKHSHKKESSSKKRKYHSHDKIESVDDFMSSILPLPNNTSSEYLMPKMNSEPQSVPVTLDSSGTILPPTDIAASWRGRMDPERVKAISDYKERLTKTEKLGPQAKRDEFEGFGGMNRRR